MPKLIKEKLCKNCGRELTKPNAHLFCNYTCYYFYTKKVDNVKAAQAREEKANNKWKKSTIGMLNKFYQIFGKNKSCCLCGMTYEENEEEFNMPLYIQLQKDIRDYRVMDPRSWDCFCIKCVLKIQSIKDENKSIEDKIETIKSKNDTQD